MKLKKVLQKCEEMANQGKSLEGKKLENCTNAGNAVMQGMMKDLTKGLMDCSSLSFKYSFLILM